MGLRPLDLGQWLEVDGQRQRELDQKWAILDQPAGWEGAVATTEGTAAAAAELLQSVLDHLETHHPGLIEVTGDGTDVTDRRSGRRVDVARLHPIDAAGRLVQEDLCLMVRAADGWILGAASVCFPSRWSLADKIGRDLRAIHAPVPGYRDSLGAPVDAFFDRLRVERPVWRLNWTLLDTPELRLPGGAGRTPGGADGALGAMLRPADLGQRVWFRVERQTLRRLESSGAIAFTIRTYVSSLSDLVRSHPQVVDALQVSLPTVPPDSMAYKGWTALVPELLDWLAATSDRTEGHR